MRLTHGGARGFGKRFAMINGKEGAAFDCSGSRAERSRIGAG
jgi:hypothetical protein